MRVRIEVRAAELRREIELIEARNVGTNEPVIRQLRAQLAELEVLLAGDADWRAKVRERKARVAGAVGDFMDKRRER